MARIRTIKPEFFCHEELFDLEAETGLPIRIAFAGLWTVCDREGRFKWRPRTIKAQILPYDNVDFSRVLDALATRGFVVRYTSNGCEYGHVPGFGRHQVINNRELASVLPEPPKTPQKTDLPPVDDACPTREGRVPHAGQGEWNGMEGNRKGTEGEGEGNHSHTPPILKSVQPPDELTPHWNRWCEYALAIGKPVNAIQADTLLMELGRRGTAKAIRDIDFSIRKSAKSILDSDNDFEKQATQPRSYAQTPRTRNYT